MKVKNDHRSKFSNLSNRKKKPEKIIRASTGSSTGCLMLLAAFLTPLGRGFSDFFTDI